LVLVLCAVALLIGVVVLGFCGYELAWKKSRLRADLALLRADEALLREELARLTQLRARIGDLASRRVSGLSPRRIGR